MTCNKTLLPRSFFASIGFHLVFFLSFSIPLLLGRKPQPHYILPVELASNPTRSHSFSKQQQSHAFPHTHTSGIAPKDEHASTDKKAEVTPSNSEASNSATRASLLQQYVMQIMREIDQKKAYPRESLLREEEGRVILSLTIDSSGNVSESHIDTPSPFKNLNEAAIQTIRSIPRFPAPPAGVPSIFKLKVPVSYSLLGTH